MAEGTFAAAYEVNARNAVADALDANIAVSTFRDFMEDRPDGKWKGTATQLHAALTERIRKPEHDADGGAQEGGRRRDPDLQGPDGGETARGAAGRSRRHEFWLAEKARWFDPRAEKSWAAITQDRHCHHMAYQQPRSRASIIWERPRTKSCEFGFPGFPGFPNGGPGNENNDLNGKIPGSHGRGGKDFRPGP